jgi:pimeloyl-ACP methyl ester carboxylesterase
LNTDATIQLLILPGLGGDHRMAYPQLTLPYEIITPDYFSIEPKESLRDYSKRFCEHLVSIHAIDLERPLCIAGYSFGSAIAQELSNIISCKAIVIIGGLRNGRELSPFVRWFGKWLAPRLPIMVYRFIGLFLPFVMRRLSEISENDLKLCRRMYFDFPRGMFRRGYSLLAKWKGCPVNVPILRIRGKLDHIIGNISEREDASSICISDAKHLVNLSKPEIVNAAIEQFIESFSL